MIAAILLCGLGYAEGATLSRQLGGWQVISWALLLSLPLMAAITLFTLPASWISISAPAWISLGYVSIFSMLVGFVFWYRGLALLWQIRSLERISSDRWLGDLRSRRRGGLGRGS
jgi:drug/metabolite transporter (DMT)-like permease